MTSTGKHNSMKRFHETAENISSILREEEDYEKHKAGLEQLRKMVGQLVSLRIEKIDTTKNIRAEIHDDDDFKTLVASVREIGLLHPVVVTVVGDSVLCVSGHRRLAALREIGEEKALCLVQSFDSLDAIIMAQLIENKARADLDVLDVAEAFHSLRERGYSQSKIGEIFDRDRNTIGRYQKMASWPDEAKTIIRRSTKKVSARDLIHLASRSLSGTEVVDVLERLTGERDAPSKPTLSPGLTTAIESLKVAQGLSVRAKGTEEKGTITFAFGNKEEFESLMMRFQ